MEDHDFQVLADMLASAGKPAIEPTADIVVKDCYNADLEKLVGDRIYGLLTQDSITIPQLKLLSILMGALT